MCNCNQKRQTFSNGSGSSVNRAKVRYTGADSFSIHGDITGRMYNFTQGRTVIFVDPRDAEGFREVEELQVIS